MPWKRVIPAYVGRSAPKKSRMERDLSRRWARWMEVFLANEIRCDDGEYSLRAVVCALQHRSQSSSQLCVA